MEAKPKRTFHQQAARGSWILPIAALILMAVGNPVLREAKTSLTGIIVGGVFLFLLLAGVVLGIIGCFGVKKHGAKTTLIPGLIGAFASLAMLGILTGIAVPSFINKRADLSAQRSSALKEMVEQANKQLPIMTDSETRADRLAVLGPNSLEYNFTFVNRKKDDFNVEEFKAAMRSQLLVKYYTSEKFRPLREGKISIRYSYHDKFGQPIATIVVPLNEPSGE